MRYFIVKDNKIVRGLNIKPVLSIGEKLIETKTDIPLKYAYLTKKNTIANVGSLKESYGT